MEQSVEIMAGISFLILGLSYFFHARDWIEWFETVRNGGRQTALAVGAMHILFGSFIVAFHWVWSGWETILTVLGIWAIAEGFIYLLFPGHLAKFMGWLKPYYKPILRIFSIAIILLGLALLCPVYREGVIL